MSGRTLFLPEVSNKLFLFKKSLHCQAFSLTGNENKGKDESEVLFPSKFVYRILRGIICNNELRFKNLHRL